MLKESMSRRTSWTWRLLTFSFSNCILKPEYSLKRKGQTPSSKSLNHATDYGVSTKIHWQEKKTPHWQLKHVQSKLHLALQKKKKTFPPLDYKKGKRGAPINIWDIYSISVKTQKMIVSNNNNYTHTLSTPHAKRKFPKLGLGEPGTSH